MKIVFVNTNPVRPRIAPLGIEYLAEHLSRKHKVTIIDQPDFIRRMRSGDFDIVALSIRCVSDFTPLIKLMKKVKEKPGVRVVIGGSQVNLSGDELRRCLGADHAVLGRGLKAFDRLLADIKKNKARTIYVGDEGDVVRGKFKRNMISHKKYADSCRTGVTTKFGCPFSCAYCNYPLIEGSKIYKRNPSEVVFEIENLSQQGVREISFNDPVFNFPSDHAIKILKAIRKKGLKIQWKAMVNPSSRAFTEEFIEEAAATGMKSVLLAVDSLSERGLRLLNRPFTIRDVFDAVELCRKNEVKFFISILFGHPDETRADIEETFRNLDLLRPAKARIGNGIEVYPGTPLFFECQRRKILPKDFYSCGSFVLVNYKDKKTIKAEIKKRPYCFESNDPL